MSLATAKATALLQPPASSNALGVREESVLKAEKWSLATRLRDLRVASEKTREELTAGEHCSCQARRELTPDLTDQEALSRRRDLVKRRRQNLDSARILVSNLTSPTLVTSVPPSVASHHATQALVEREHHAILNRMHETRFILAKELLNVYGFAPAPIADRPLPSPFKSPSSSVSSLSDSTTSVPSSLILPNPSHLPTYVLGQLSLPPLSLLPSLPPPPLSAVLNHLLHLVRLLALYYDFALPFTPLPSLFGPGRPGLRATPGCGGSVPSAGGANGGLASWPVFLPRSSSKMEGGDKLSLSPGGTELLPPAAAGSESEEHQTGGRELDKTMRDQEKRQSRMRAVMTGAVALVFDLAWIVWKRGAEVGIDELEDIGALINRATGNDWSAGQK